MHQVGICRGLSRVIPIESNALLLVARVTPHNIVSVISSGPLLDLPLFVPSSLSWKLAVWGVPDFCAVIQPAASRQGHADKSCSFSAAFKVSRHKHRVQ